MEVRSSRFYKGFCCELPFALRFVREGLFAIRSAELLMTRKFHDKCCALTKHRFTPHFSLHCFD